MRPAQFPEVPLAIAAIQLFPEFAMFRGMTEILGSRVAGSRSTYGKFTGIRAAGDRLLSYMGLRDSARYISMPFRSD